MSSTGAFHRLCGGESLDEHVKLCALAKGALTKALVCAGAMTELPDDGLLPGLVAIRSTGGAAAIPMMELNGEPVELALRGYTAGSRLRLEVRAGRLHFAVKAYACDPSLEAELYRLLAATGLGGGTVRVPPLLAWDFDLRLMVLGWFDGPTAKDLIVAGHGSAPAKWPHSGCGARCRCRCGSRGRYTRPTWCERCKIGSPLSARPIQRWGSPPPRWRKSWPGRSRSGKDVTSCTARSTCAISSISAMGLG